MASEGVKFVNNAHVGVTHDIEEIRAENDALIMATGATWPRDLKMKNRELDGIHFGAPRLPLLAFRKLTRSPQPWNSSARTRRCVRIV